MPSIYSIILTLLLPILALAAPYQTSPFALITLTASWEGESNAPCNRTFSVPMNRNFHLANLYEPEVLYLTQATGVDPKTVVCKPYWTGSDGQGIMGLFLTKKAPSRTGDIAGGEERFKNSELDLRCQVGTQ